MKTKFFGVAIATVAVGYLLYRRFRKEVKNLKEEEEKNEKELESLGVSKESREKISEEMLPGDDNLVKALYAGIQFNSDWDIDIINIDSCLKNENVIHVGMERSQTGSSLLTLLVEIPAIKEGNYRSPKIGDFVTALSKASEQMYNIAGITNEGVRPITRLVGYFVVSYKDEENKENKYEFIKIPQELHRSYARGKHDGLVEYISALRSGQESGTLDMETSDGREFRGEAIDVQLFFKISFPIKGGIITNGIDLGTGLKCLKYIIDEVQVGEEITYDYIMFHAPDENGKWNLFKYYTINEKRQIIIDEYTY